LFFDCGKSGKPKSYLARVNNSYFTYKDLENEVSSLPYLGQVDDNMIQQIVDNWIVEEILYQSAKSTDAPFVRRVDSEMKKIKRIRIGELYLQQIASRGVQIGDLEALDYYAEHKSNFLRKNDAVLVDLFRGDSTDAHQVSSLLKREKEVPQSLIARCFVDNRWISKNSISEPFNKNLFIRKKYRTTVGALFYRGSYWVAKIRDRATTGDTVSFDFVQDEIYQILYHEKKMQMEQFAIDSLKNLFQIDIPRRNL